MDSYGPGFHRNKARILANVISATNQKASFNLEPIEIRVGRKHMFLFSNLNFEKLKNQSSFTLWGILILIPWNQFWQNRSFRNWKNFYGDNQFSFDDKRREFVHSNYSLLHGLTWSRVEIRLVPELLVTCDGYLSCSIDSCLDVKSDNFEAMNLPIEFRFWALSENYQNISNPFSK